MLFTTPSCVSKESAKLLFYFLCLLFSHLASARSPGATTLLDTSYDVVPVTRYACIHQIPAPFVLDATLCSAPSYVAPAPPTSAPLAPGAAAGVTVTFKLRHVS
jgi:hypothetical protein